MNDTNSYNHFVEKVKEHLLSEHVEKGETDAQFSESYLLDQINKLKKENNFSVENHKRQTAFIEMF